MGAVGVASVCNGRKLSYSLLFRNHIITDGDAIFHPRNQLQGFQIAGIYKYWI
jgi:hypothetical protein